MKRWMIYLFVVVTALAGYWFFQQSKKNRVEDAPKPISLSVHSAAFNKAVGDMMSAYFDLKDAFVEYDSVKVKTNAARMLSLLDSIPMQELEKDTLAVTQAALAAKEDIKRNIASLIEQSDWKTMKQDFSSASDMMYPGFFKVINYDGPKMFLQHCPMAFGEDQGANWISNSNKVINPYLGKHDATYGAGMLSCGEVVDSLGK